jgi:NAD+ synthetase
LVARKSTVIKKRGRRASYDLPKINLAKTIDKLTADIRKIVNASGKNKVLIGLSGGVDSSVLSSLACRAVGPENVYALQLTYVTDEELRVKDGGIVARELGIRFKRLDITEPVELLAEMLRLPFHGEEAAIRRQEILDRVRALILMDISEQENMVFLSAANKTESILGLGLTCGLFAPVPRPLIGLYKTYIFRLAEILGLPEQVLIRQPSMDLWKSPLDAPLREVYEKIDKVIYLRIEKKFPPSRIKQAGFPPRFVNAVLRRIEEVGNKRS